MADGFGYDLLDRLTSAAQPGHTLSFPYGALGRQLTQSGPLGTIGSAWDLAGRRISLTRGNGTVTSYAWDPASRLSQLVQDLAGATHDLNLGFAYNPAGQIVSNSRSNDLYSFTGIAAGTTNSVANGLNQIVSHGGLATSHDARGNMTNDLTGSYSYSSENLLTSGPAGASLAYDPAMRLFQVGGGATARFAWDGFSMVAEYNAANALQYRYVHGAGQPAPAEAGEPLVQYDGPGTGGRRFLHADERGSIVAHSDSAGSTIALNRYDEYGLPASGNAGRFQYTGQAWLPEIGLFYYRARMYNPRLGRFLQTDPIGYGDGMNVYAYVRGDPVNRGDPSGLSSGDIYVDGKRVRIDSGGGGGLAQFGSVANIPEPENDRFEEIVSPEIIVIAQTIRPEPQGQPHVWGPLIFNNFCSAREAFNMLRRPGMSAPGAPYAREGRTPRVTLYGGNPIEQNVDVRNMTITNTALRGHRYYPGAVLMSVIPNRSGSTIFMLGTGTGDHATENVIFGTYFFRSVGGAIVAECSSPGVPIST